LFNFSANRINIISTKNYDKCNVYIGIDLDTKRCYKIYDYSKSAIISIGKVYCISGKINSADKLYLILENFKEDKKYNQYKIINVQKA
jgi:hypothetical protein